MYQVARILCPVDFSDCSRHALDYAVALARLYESRIAVLYVHWLAVPVPAIAYAGTAQPLPLTDLERADIQQCLSEFVADDRKAGIRIETLFEEDLMVSAAIVDAAAKEDADLVVIGTHGRSGFNRFVLGSVANKVMKTAECPVLMVPPRARTAVPVVFQRIVCPVDF